MELTQHQADAFARMPLTYLRQEYPNHIMHLLNDDGGEGAGLFHRAVPRLV